MTEIIPPTQEGISASEAAARLGISERTLRERIKTGKIRATKVVGVNGNAVYRVFLDDTPPSTEPTPPPAAGSPTMTETMPPPKEGTTPPSAEVLALVALVERITRENLELAGRVGFLQAKLQDAEEEIRMLRAPAQSPEPEMTNLTNHPAHVENRADSGDQKVSARPWWQFWRSG